MSNNKSTTLSVSDIPRFNGRNFQGWSEKMIGVFMMAKVYEVVNRNTTAPTEWQTRIKRPFFSFSLSAKSPTRHVSFYILY